MFTPTSAIRLLSVPLQSDYKNTLWFPDRATQTSYFLGKTIKTFEEYNYVKKNNTIVVDGKVDLLYNCNYIMYQNNNFSNKWFYAFINRTEWASNNSTRLYVSTDVIQTWFFDITYYQSYVDRCHSDTDVAGDNIVPEDFSGSGTGGYYQVGSQDLTPNMLAIFSTTYTDGSPLPTQKINGIFSGSGYLTNPIDISTSVATVNTWLGTMVRQGLATAVSRIQQYPTKHDTVVSFAKHPSHIDCATNTGTTSYTPTNKKLLSGAFLSCYISLYGQEMTFNPEYITGANVSVKIAVDQSTGTVGAIVNNYSNSNVAALTVTAVIPESTWAYNQYKNDYNLHSASNAIMVQRAKENRRFNLYQGALSGAGGALQVIGAGVDLANPVTWTKGGVGTALSSGISGAQTVLNAAQETGQIQAGIDEITQDLTAISENYNAPAVGGVASSNIFLAGGKTAMSYGFKTPPLDLVKRFDKFLTVYGYKQSIYRTINLHARASWTFIKTNGLNATGNFPDDDMNQIKRAFNNGIFFWVYSATFGNFDQANGIV